MAEWLRRWTRNPLGSPRAGSNPADYVSLTFNFTFKKIIFPSVKFCSMIHGTIRLCGQTFSVLTLQTFSVLTHILPTNGFEEG